MKQIFKVIKNDAKRAVSKITVATINDKQYCYDTLNEVSRSFAMVIQDLPEALKDAICIFYLQLRALDTIEDDMQLDRAVKIQLLSTFQDTCGDELFSLQNIGDREVYVQLLQNLPRINREYNKLEDSYQLIIKEIASEMAQGMLLFEEKPVTTKEDYDLYCHYVAGIVGQGLSKMFVASGLEDTTYLEKMDTANGMGLFLQKTNITRDFYEDVDEGRIFWPEEIWKDYTTTLNTLKEKPTSPKSYACLNKMVENALTHFEDSISYLEGLQNEKIFRFCAIPQVMAIGTLSVVCNNPLALTENVKLERKTTMQIFSKLNNMKDFAFYAIEFLEKFPLKETDVSLEVVLGQYKNRLQKFL